MPVITIKEINAHRANAGKKGEIIAKTMDRGKKFKEERYINANNILTAVTSDGFLVKTECKPSMGGLGTTKKKNKIIKLQLAIDTGTVQYASCTCRQGDGGLCHHVVALLLELAEYSLSMLKEVPDELACTSRLRAWGVPGNTSMAKEPIMATKIFSRYNKRGTTCTLYDPRIHGSRRREDERTDVFEHRLLSKDPRIGFAHCRDHSITATTNTKYGEFVVGSPLSFHLAPIELNHTYVTNILGLPSPVYSTFPFVPLPLAFHPDDHDAFPTDWLLNEHEIRFLRKLELTQEQSYQMEQATITQSQCDLWFEQRKHRITSSKAHSIFTRKRNFETLVESILNPQPKSQLPSNVRDALDYGIHNEPIARGKYIDILKYELKRDINVREAGLVVQPNLFWVAASPDGLITDRDAGIGLIEIKCPKSKKSLKPNDLVKDPKFYVQIEDGAPKLKRNHEYFTQIQMAMGLAGAPFCDFIVYTLEGLIIVRTPYDHKYFVELMKKVNEFYKKYILPKLSEQTIDFVVGPV